MKTIASRGAKEMGRVSVEFEVANADDRALVRRKLLRTDEVRRQTIQGIVDSGATKLVLPAAVAEQLGLSMTGKVRVRYADGRSRRRSEAEAVHVEMLGRQGVFAAIIEPDRENALIGAMVLEGLDLLVDCKNQRVVPRDPAGAIFEIE